MDCLFVGAGSIAEPYAASLEPTSVSLAGVCDLDADRAAALAEEYGCRSFADLDRALTAVDAPVVVNLTSHAAHADVTETALAADRHVYSQKPLALDADRAAGLLESARNRDLALGCAPEPHRAPAQRRAGRLLADGRLGPVRLAYAHAHVGRVTDWHDHPGSFLDIGPLYDGGVYPLSLLASWFGPVERVRTADTLDIWPERESQHPSAPSHVETTLSFSNGSTVRLTASLYAPHRGREFYGLELHGDDGSLYLDGAGAMADSADAVQFGRVGREYTSVPPQTPTDTVQYAEAVARFTGAIARGERPSASARRGAHVVAVCNAIERAAEAGGPVRVEDFGTEPVAVPPPVVGPLARDDAGDHATLDCSLWLPPVGFGCSRYRDGEYVDRTHSIACAMDAGYRLFDSAELYGNEFRIGDLLSAPGAPDTDAVFLLGKVWRTNHRREHLLEACAGSLQELGVDAVDCYALHWPDAWEHQGPLDRLAEAPVTRQEALTFPEAADGTPAADDVSLAQAWANLEGVYDRGWARSLGVCNVSVAQLETILETCSVPPALVSVERHPYWPRWDLLERCRKAGIRVVAHAPLSAPGLLDEPVLAAVGERDGLSPAGVVIAWNVTAGVVPVPSSTTLEHVTANLAAAGTRLDDRDRARIDGLADPAFER